MLDRQKGYFRNKRESEQKYFVVFNEEKKIGIQEHNEKTKYFGS